MKPAAPPPLDRPSVRLSGLIGCALLAGLLAGSPQGIAAAANPAADFQHLLNTFAAFNDRSTGTAGNEQAAGFIKEVLERMNIGEVASHAFAVPVIRRGASSLEVPQQGVTLALHALAGNALTPQSIPRPGLTGPLVYVGDGELERLNGKPIEGAVLVMELHSGRNWLQAANLGAGALIYVDRGDSTGMDFEEKFELSPIQFPRFWMPVAALREAFGEFEAAEAGLLADAVRLHAEAAWENVVSENIYCIVPGASPDLRGELLVVEAFYDGTAHVAGLAPGADEAVGAATLLQVAQHLKENPPARTVMLVASSGHAQALAGLRELVWSFTARSRDLRDARNDLRRFVKQARLTLQALKSATFEASTAPPPAGPADEEDGNIADPEALLKAALEERLKTDADIVSRQLMRLRLEDAGADPQLLPRLTAERQLLRRLMWRTDYREVTPVERRALLGVAARARKDQEAMLSDARLQLRLVESAAALRSALQEYEIVAAVSLHLSSRGNGFGAFNYGWLYPFRPRINRTPAYSRLDEVLKSGAAEVERRTGAEGMLQDTLRPSRMRAWQGYFLDRPALGGEVTALAGIHGITLTTTGDARAAWGTPHDRVDRVQTAFAQRQSAVVSGLIGHLGRATNLRETEAPRNGFSTINGRAKFLRHGELFADKPAPGTLLLCYQGPARFHVMVDQRGRFSLKGVADRTHSFHKVVLEAYRFEPETGEAVWTIDKKLTGKDAYRVKMNRRFMETDLVMFAGSGTTLFNLLEPRTFRYLTKADVIDGRREADPARWFMSRLDTWSSTISTVFLEPGTPLKMTLTDTVLRRKLILINSSPEDPTGKGYEVVDYPRLNRTEHRVAGDMWNLLGPRIANLEARGIFNEHIRNLQEQGLADLKAAGAAWDERRYDRFIEASTSSWALAARVYDEVEKTQKDVLYGVLFYIALFVPFAFCLERLLFAYANIYRRIIAFGLILAALIALIYNVHPAFQLAYSPLVVILAFLIMGLSLVVTLIVFVRFEEEIAGLQARARTVQAGEMGRWKAFGAAFLLGVSNLRRRRLRTALTCITLVILTFTIMSFTSVKSLRRQARILYEPQAPYQGFLLKNVNWSDLPAEALGVLAATFSGKGTAVPRAWLEASDRTRPTFSPLRANGREAEAQGVMGLSPDEPRLSGIDAILEGGRWFTAAERRSVLLPDRMASLLGIDPRRPEGGTISLWGMPFEVVGVFSARKLQERLDLDGEPLTPVTFPREASAEMTEEEVESLESGEDLREFQSRYQHTAADLTVILPYPTLIAAGGRLKSVAVRIESPEEARAMARHLVDRFGLSLFSGEPEGTFLYHASDAMSYSGVPNIIIPLGISVFIVLNTMIGSVYERKREIAVYTSVGLAPSHVSFLFIAEALAFAVLSVVFGYLVAQTTAKIFAGTMLWTGITVNYSSLAGVAAMLLVIAVVLVSVIYPSRVAAEIAIPDVNRSWTLPPARANTIEVLLPFLMTYREHMSVGGFLVQYFDGHMDVSHGLFSTSDIVLDFACETAPRLADRAHNCPEQECELPECLHLTSQVWLAPFDFGIMQRAEFRFRPSPDQAGFLEIHVRLVRESGESNIWHRINKGFLHEIRRQLLIWRSLDDDAKALYEQHMDEFRGHAAPAAAPAGGAP
ncbi:MAG: FtsX-like permease family protein [Desulfobacterales bacterium]